MKTCLWPGFPSWFTATSLGVLLQTGTVLGLAWHLPAEGQETAKLSSKPNRGYVSLTCWHLACVHT